MKNFGVASALLLLTSVLDADVVKVASTSNILSDIARNVGGDRVKVIEIIKAGVDPHQYEATPRDIEKIASARLVLASGLGFESFLNDLKSSGSSQTSFVVAGDALKPLLIDEDSSHESKEHGHDHSHIAKINGKIVDPHWWHSVRNVEAVTRQIRDALIAVDPEGRESYQKNAEAFQTKLERLSKWLRVELAKLPKSKRILVTSHDGLGYFARDYGFRIYAVQGISTTDEPSSYKARLLIQTIKEEGIKAIFAENIENPKVIQQITEETGAKLGGVLYVDGLGTGEASTYEGMMHSNVKTIVDALR